MLTANVDSISTNDSTKQVYIKVSLYNKTFHTIKYLSMSCSWRDAFTTGSNEFEIYNDQMCFSNVLILDSILSFKRNDYNLLLIAKKTTSESRCRIGFNLIESNELNYKLEYDSLRNMRHVTWSNPMDIKYPIMKQNIP